MNRHDFKPPRQILFFNFLARLLACGVLLQLRRMLMRVLSFMSLQSRVSNIVYLSWLVDAEQVRQRYPEQVTLWEKQGKTIFTILTYQHHHFGFQFLGRLRKWMPSPQQSNWRFYLDDSHPKTVIFEQVMLDQYLYVLGGRLASDVMPAQYAPVFQHQYHEQQKSIQTEIVLDPAYSFASNVQITGEKRLPDLWRNLFTSWDEAVHFLVDQDHAWAEWVDQPQRLSQGDIEMPIQFQQIQAAEMISLKAPQLLQQLGLEDNAEVFAFVVPELDFHVIGEQVLASSP